MELLAASRAAASSAKVTPRGLRDTVSRIPVTRSTVRCGRAGMRLTLTFLPLPLVALPQGELLPVRYHTSPAARCTFYCPEDNTEDTVVLVWIDGAQVSFNEDGTFHSINDATSIQYLTDPAGTADVLIENFAPGTMERLQLARSGFSSTTRACARPAERSSSAATSPSGPGAACARCQARRSGSSCGSVTSASARTRSRTLQEHSRPTAADVEDRQRGDGSMPLRTCA